MESLAEALTERLKVDEVLYFGEGFYLHEMNGLQIHRLFAPMTDYIETQSGETS